DYQRYVDPLPLQESTNGLPIERLGAATNASTSPGRVTTSLRVVRSFGSMQGEPQLTVTGTTDYLNVVGARRGGSRHLRPGLRPLHLRPHREHRPSDAERTSGEAHRLRRTPK